MTLPRKFTEAVEIQIDTVGLDEVLYEVATICHEKADHILSSYSDRVLAGKWSRVAGKLEDLAASGAVADLG